MATPGMRIGVSLPVRELKNDMAAVREFAQAAEELGFTHLRVPDQVARPKSGHLHEPLTLLSYVAALTSRIELVPSVIVLPVRQTVLVAKQAAEIDVLSGGRLRLGVGVGGSREEYVALGQDFHTRGQRCEEQMGLLKLLWTQDMVYFRGRWDRVASMGLDPLPVQRPIPIWIGASSATLLAPSGPVLRRIARQADGWFAIIPPGDVPRVRDNLRRYAESAGRDPSEIGTEGGVGVCGRTPQEWMQIVNDWQDAGATHVCMRTLGGGLDAAGHIDALRTTRKVLDGG